MKTSITPLAIVCGFLGSIAAFCPGLLRAQAPPGPLPPPAGVQLPRSQPVAAPKPRPVPPRTTLDGDWKLNHDESDDPRKAINSGSNGGQNPGGGYPGGGYPGYPGGIGFPGGYPGGGYPGGGGPYGRTDERNDERLEQIIRPAASLTFALKNAEIDVTDDQYRKIAFFTDGRQLQKSKDDSYREIAAHWEGSRLVSDEKSPEGGKMSRAFELSQDGRQFFETFNIDRSRSRGPLVVRYVYDVAGEKDTPVDAASDPDKPVLKRRSDAGDSSAETTNANGSSQTSQAQSGNTPDSNQPVLKRRSDDNSSSDSRNNTNSSGTANSSQNPEAQSNSTPDPDQPTLKRRPDDSNDSSQ